MIGIGNTAARTALGQFARFALGVALVVTLALAAIVGAGPIPGLSADGAQALPPLAQFADTDCVGGDETVADEPFVRTELFFGTAKTDGTEVSVSEWDSFLDAEITPRFPDGLTVQTGLGQWRDGEGTIVQERSMIVILLYPRDAVDAAGDEIEEIRAAYEDAFQQQSVLRSDDSLPVCVSF
jgi:hypothetical protein